MEEEKQKKVLLIGAGKIGSIIAHMLATNGYDITVADMNGESLSHKKLKDFKQLVLNVFNSNELIKTLEDQDYVINAGPYFLAEHIAIAAAATNTHYVDLTEDIEQTKLIRKIAIQNRTKCAFIPQSGLAPGFIAIVANDLAKKFDTVEDVKMRVGALPRFPNNSLKYNMTWSTDGLVNEYLHPCNAVQNGKLVDIESLEGLESFSLDGDPYEAFNTSGGLGTLCETWKGKVNNMNYKTIRYPGHRDLMKFLIDEMKLGENDGKPLKELMDKAIPITDQDVVVIFVSVSGYKNGKFLQETWTKKIYSQERFGYSWTAIQLTTGASVCAIIDLHASKKLPQKGFVKQESANLEDFLNTNCGGIYNG